MRFQVTSTKPEKETKPSDKLFIIICAIANLIISTLFPFILGFYFAITKNVLWLLLLVPSIILNIRIVYEEGELNVKIIRGGF